MGDGPSKVHQSSAEMGFRGRTLAINFSEQALESTVGIDSARSGICYLPPLKSGNDQQHGRPTSIIMATQPLNYSNRHPRHGSWPRKHVEVWETSQTRLCPCLMWTWRWGYFISKFHFPGPTEFHPKIFTSNPRFWSFPQSCQHDSTCNCHRTNGYAEP
jgi:hypothetical protein